MHNILFEYFISKLYIKMKNRHWDS